MKLKVLFYYYNIVNFTHTLNVLFITKLAFLCQFFNFEKCGRPGGGVWPRGRPGGGFGLTDVCGQGGGRGLEWPKFCGRPLWTAPYNSICEATTGTDGVPPAPYVKDRRIVDQIFSPTSDTEFIFGYPFFPVRGLIHTLLRM